MLAQTAPAAAKYAPPAAGIAIAEWTVGGIRLEIAGAILIGLVAGAVLRSSRFIERDAGWKAVSKDWLLSAMSGLANFIIAAIVVALGSLAVPGFPVLAAAGVGLFFGHQGPEAINWFRRKFFGEEPLVEAPPPAPIPPPIDYAGKPPETPEPLNILARKLDKGNDRGH